MTHEYLFDVKMFAAFRFNAPDEATARKMLSEALDCVSITVPIGDQTVTGEASEDGEADLMEIDGEDPESWNTKAEDSGS